MLLNQEFKKTTGIKITTEHTGKMSGLWSLSTPCGLNPNCERNAKIEGSICSKCYAMKQLKRYKNQADCYAINFEVLTSRVLDESELPLLTCLLFRFEAFGDLVNEIQLINYFNIAKANPSVNCALWTKNYHIVKAVIESGHAKPKNLNIIISSLFINQELDIRGCQYADKVFSVFDKAHAQDINCGSRKCAECRRCYTKNDEVYIRELLK